MKQRGQQVLPNFLYIGPDKGGSTWIYQALKWHPQVLTASAKELQFFHRYYENGLDWYASHFQASGPPPPVVVEICHDYLYAPDALGRIVESLPDVRVMVCLREPVDRAFSSFLNMSRFGLVNPDFERAMEEKPGLINHGRYARYLKPYLEALGRERVYTAVYDDLVDDPQAFAQALFEYLGIDQLALPDELLGRALPAGQARFKHVSRWAKKGAVFMRDAGFPNVVSTLKSSPFVQKSLYRQFSDGEKPQLPTDLSRRLRTDLRADVESLDRMLGLDLCKRWGYL